MNFHYYFLSVACGHVSCFWCVHKSMDGLRESHCPICRHPYYHFPTICQMFHVLLLKIYPVDYQRREKQTLGMFPFLSDYAWAYSSINLQHALSNYLLLKLLVIFESNIHKKLIVTFILNIVSKNTFIRSF